MLKRMFSLFLSIVMVLSCVPFQAFATEVTEEPAETVQVEETVEILPEETQAEETVPEVTEPEVTEPEVTEPEVTEPEATEPEATESENVDTEVPGLYAASDPAPIYEYLTVTSFEELKALASQTYDQRTVVYYEGEEPLVITEDLVLPSYFVLDLTGYYSCGRMEIVRGVTLETSDFSNELVVGEMIVNGRFVGRGYTMVSDYLEVNGSVYLTADMRLDRDAVVVGGHNVECADNIQMCRNEYAHSAAEFTEILRRAEEDLAHNISYQLSYWVNPGEDHVLREDALIPANVRLYMSRNYDSYEVFTVAEGVTLSVESAYGVGIDADVVIHGHLENDAKALSVYGTLTFSETGSYDGDGVISRYSEDTTEQLSDWLVGLDLSKLYIVENRYPEYGYVEWTLKSKASLPQLPTPTGLKWNKAVEYTWDQNFENVKEKLVTQNGSVAWDMTGSYEGSVEVEFFHEDGTRIYGFSTYFGLMEGMKLVSTNEFAFMDVESGGYYFTVRFLGDGINYGDSEAAVSDIYNYKRPDKVLGTCTDLVWNWPATDWKSLKNFSGSYEVEFYYAPTADAEQKLIYKDYGYADYYRPTLWELMIQENGAGYYFFRVRAISNDVEKIRNGAWSEMSPAYILDPALESVKSRLDSISTKADDQYIRDAVQAIGMEDLIYAIGMDSNVLTRLEELEKAVGGAASVRSNVPVINAENVSVMGANLNVPVDASKPISLVLDAPMMNNTLSEEYDADVAVSFSMSLENTEYQAVPMKVTLPVPANINLEQLVLLHYNVYGGVEEYTLRDLEVTQKNGTTFVSLLLTDLGDFVLTNYAALIVDDGIVGEVNWELNSWGELRIFGEGEAVIYANRTNPWRDYSELITSVIVEEGVDEIYDYVFFRLPNLRSVSLPNTLLELGNRVFAECTSLETITLPASLEHAGQNMFEGCTSMKEILVEEGNETVFDRDGVLFQYVYMGEYDDQDVYDLNIVSYPIGRENTSYVVPQDVRTIAYCAFEGAKNLEEIIIPESVYYVESFAFNNTSLKEITIPASVQYFESEQFLGCDNLETITFLGDVPEYSEYCLEGVTATAYYPAGNETWTEDVFESFRGDITWLKSDYIEISGDKEVIGGKTLKLTAAILPENPNGHKISWSLAEGDEEYVTLKASGNSATLTAVDVSEPHTVTVIASSAEGIAPAAFEVNVLPQVKELRLYERWVDEEGIEQWMELGSDWWYWDLTEDRKEGFTMQLMGEFWPNGSSADYTWSSSNPKVATIDEYGLVSFTGTTGSVTFTLKTDNGVKASVLFKVIDTSWDIAPIGESYLELIGGQSTTLKIKDVETDKPITGKNVEWGLWMEQGDVSAYASISASGKLTTQKVHEPVTFSVYAEVLRDGVYVNYVQYQVTLYPATTHVELFKGNRNITGDTVKYWLNEEYAGESMTISAEILPGNAMSVPVSWTISDKQNKKGEYAYANYTVEGNQLKISNPTGKAGTVTITATAQDGSKKSATVKVKFGTYAEDVIVETAEAELVSGKSMTLKATTYPENVTSKGVVWSLCNPADSAFVTLSGSKLTAKAVYEEKTVTLQAESKDGEALGYCTVTILPKDPGALTILRSWPDAEKAENVTKSTVNVNINRPENCVVHLLPGDDTDVIWTVKGKNVSYEVTEEGGLKLTVLKAGSVTVTAKDANDSKRSATVTIKAAKLATGMEITTKDGKNLVYNEYGEREVVVASGKSVNLKALVEGNSGSKLEWFTDLGGSYGTVSASGKFTANKNITSEQEVYVYARAKDGSNVMDGICVRVKPLATGIQIYTLEQDMQMRTIDAYSNSWMNNRSNTNLTWDMMALNPDGTPNDSFQVYATVYPFDEEDSSRNAIQDVTWKSSSTKVATVSQDGLVTCKGAGTTTITCTAADGSGQKISFKLTVVKRVQNIYLDDANVVGGKSLSLKPIFEPLDATNKKLRWEIYGDTTFASISQSGKLTTKKVTEPKTVWVYARAQDGSYVVGGCEITIWPKAVNKIELWWGGEAVTGKTIEIEERSLSWMDVRISPEGKTCQNVTWKSSDPESVTVEEGGLISVFKETKKPVTITCTAADGSGKKATVKIKVVEQVQVEETGSVYYLNYKPEFDNALQELASAYCNETGTSVKIISAAYGTYGDVLNQVIDEVTVFNIFNETDMASWDAHTLDLRNTSLARELYTDEFNLYNASGELKAIGNAYESYGLIVNTELLAQYGYTVDDINCFEDLKTVCETISESSEETGVYAFSDPSLDMTSSWRFSGHLANMPLFYEFRDRGITEQPAQITGAYLDNYKNIWDLYINNTAADPAELEYSSGEWSRVQFAEGNAVFYQNGTWEYELLLNMGMTDDQLAMIPIYCGVEGEEKAGLCSGTESHWAINANASAADIRASIDFLTWMVSNPKAAQIFTDNMGAVPFKNCPESGNKFNADGKALLEKGNFAVTWAFNYTPNVDSWRSNVVAALSAYSAGYDSWDAVVSAFVDGWAYEYEIMHG